MFQFPTYTFFIHTTRTHGNCIFIHCQFKWGHHKGSFLWLVGWGFSYTPWTEFDEFHCDTITRLIHPINFNYRYIPESVPCVMRCWSINPESNQLMNNQPTSKWFTGKWWSATLLPPAVALFLNQLMTSISIRFINIFIWGYILFIWKLTSPC